MGAGNIIPSPSLSAAAFFLRASLLPWAAPLAFLRRPQDLLTLSSQLRGGIGFLLLLIQWALCKDQLSVLSSELRITVSCFSFPSWTLMGTLLLRSLSPLGRLRFCISFKNCCPRAGHITSLNGNLLCRTEQITHLFVEVFIYDT